MLSSVGSSITNTWEGNTVNYFSTLEYQTYTHLVSSIISTSGGAVIGVFEWPAVGSSFANSPLVEDTTYWTNKTFLQYSYNHQLKINTFFVIESNNKYVYTNKNIYDWSTFKISIIKMTTSRNDNTKINNVLKMLNQRKHKKALVL